MISITSKHEYDDNEEVSPLSRAPELEPHHRMQFSVIVKTRSSEKGGRKWSISHSAH